MHQAKLQTYLSKNKTNIPRYVIQANPQIALLLPNGERQISYKFKTIAPHQQLLPSRIVQRTQYLLATQQYAVLTSNPNEKATHLLNIVFLFLVLATNKLQSQISQSKKHNKSRTKLNHVNVHQLPCLMLYD